MYFTYKTKDLDWSFHFETNEYHASSSQHKYYCWIFSNSNFECQYSFPFSTEKDIHLFFDIFFIKINKNFVKKSVAKFEKFVNFE